MLILSDRLAIERLSSGSDIVRTTPPPLAELWERGRAAGLHLGELYVLTRPLAPHSRAAYNHDTGDVWVWWDDRCPERAAADLLHELAHAQRGCRRVTTIAAYCRDEAATQRQAHRLARAWGVPALFPDHLRDAYVAFMETLRDDLPLAGDLAGTHSLPVAQAAYDALRALAARHGWQGEAWQDLLWGDTHEPDSPGYTAIAHLDRCLLRPCWTLGYGHGEGFDVLGGSPAPHAPQIAHTLRSTLQEAARRGRAIARAATRLGVRYGTRSRLGCYPVDHLRDAFPFIVAANQALLGHPEWSAEACWRIYRDAPEQQGPDGRRARHYTLAVEYQPPIGDTPTSPRPPAVHLRAIVSGRQEVDALLTLYIRGWARSTALRTGTPEDAVEEWAHEQNTGRHVSS